MSSNNQKLLALVRLARPANLPTAAADILAGVAVAGIFENLALRILDGTDNGLLVNPSYKVQFGEDAGILFSNIPIADIFLLVCASVFLYAGGVILNDVFDYRLDAVERPERPIPSGLVSVTSASIYGFAMLFIGMLLAFLVNLTAGWVALTLAICIVFYDAVAKKNGFFGPLAMGCCRGLNLLLGMSVFANPEPLWLASIPITYIFAITLISRGEVHGDNKNHIVWAGILYACVIFAIGAMALSYTDSILFPLLFLALFAFSIFRPLIKAYKDNTPKHIKGAVMAGVLSLVSMDAALAVSFSPWWYGLSILLLLPLSMALSKMFAVT